MTPLVTSAPYTSGERVRQFAEIKNFLDSKIFLDSKKEKERK
jgi:hypothetical protein